MLIVGGVSECGYYSMNIGVVYLNQKIAAEKGDKHLS